MPRCSFVLPAAAVMATIAMPCFSQTQTAAPKASSTVAQGAPAASGQSSVPTVKASAQLVVVDVVATDGSGRPVHGLTAKDFSLTENGVLQAIKNFDEHTALTMADAARFQPMPKLPPGIFTNYTPAPASGAVNVILLDALNTPMRDQAYVRQQLLAYLKTTPPGTRVAIFGLNTRLLLLQGFTSDPELLKAVLSKHGAKGSPVLDDQVGGGGIQNSVGDDMEDGGADPEVVANVRDFEAVTQSFQLQLRAKYTLDAMNQLAKYLSMLPGRKNLIWFSGSFPIDILPDTSGTQANPFIAVASSADEFRETVTLLAKSQVAVYPVDARGLFSSPVFSVQTTRNYSGRNGAARMQQDQTKFFTQTAQEHGTMQEMADATGGRAFLNTNGLTKAVETAIEEGSNFYTLSYTPTNSERDGKLRKIKVQVARPGVKLEYRKGYYADDPEKMESPGSKADAAVTAGAGPNPRDSMHLAMMRGAPTPSEIIVKVGVVPITTGNQTEDKVAVGNIAAAKLQGPYRRYSVNYLIDPIDLAFFRAADGNVRSDFELLIFVYKPDGELINSLVSMVRIAAPLDEVKKAVAQGIIRHEEISAPAKGEYFLRIAVHDLHRERYGAVEVATSAVRNVVPRVVVANGQASGDSGQSAGAVK